MMHIPTYVGASHIHGLGLFTAVAVKKDALLWSFEENFDRRYTPEEFFMLHPCILEYFRIYGYQDIHDGLFYLTVDNDRFTNHSDSPNTYCDEGGNVRALKNIRKDQEITANYKEFMQQWDIHVPLVIQEKKHAKAAA